MHGIAKVAADRVSEPKAYSEYIKKYEFETMKVIEFENNSGTQLNQLTRPDQDISRINLESRINPDSRNNSKIQINSLIRPTFNTPLTQPTDIEIITRPTGFEILTRPTDIEILT